MKDRLAVGFVGFGLALFALSCDAKGPRPAPSTGPVDCLACAVPQDAEAPPPAVSPPPTLPAAALLPAEEDAELRSRFPKAFVQTVATVDVASRTETWALVWASKPALEARCPADSERWHAYDMQSCTGFARGLVGNAYVLRFAAGKCVDELPIGPLFLHDDNPSGVEVDGGRGPRGLSYIPPSFALSVHDFDGDGVRTEFLIHVGNGPYAMVAYHDAIGIVGRKLAPLRAAGAKTPLVATAEAWIDLERTGKGTWELECGARCGSMGSRYTLVQKKGVGIVETEYWRCAMKSETWKLGPAKGTCP